MMHSSTQYVSKLIARAKSGKPALLSRIMQEIIPFNRPHRISVIKISSEKCLVNLPDRRRNRNHLGTMHACAMATAAEFVSGLNVLEAFDITQYRLIMGRLEVDYLRRPKGGCTAYSSWGDGQLRAVRSDISTNGVASFTLTSVVLDSLDIKVAEATIYWQVKSWEKVRVK
jgi:acyl-coenzyme A thioesterase PaaI-like protein|tara:strand:- start:876 stop:1388 length:513 start_codon:yes stop_codon:yes gene_type:complete